MKKTVVVSVILTIVFLDIIAQEKPANLLGFNPSLTVEPFYESGEVDINIFPLVYLRTLNKRTDIRFTSILNLGIREEGNAISHVGFETAFPIYIFEKKNKAIHSKGFFVAPLISLTKNLLEEHNNIGLWLEPGFLIKLNDNFSLNLAMQVGTTYFNYNNEEDSWKGHFGFKIILGWWL